MIARVALHALEWAAVGLAVAAAVQAAAAGSLLLTAVSGAAAIVAALLRAIAFGRAVDRRLDRVRAALPTRPAAANDSGRWP